MATDRPWTCCAASRRFDTRGGKNIPALAESFDIVAPDLRGFGDSDKPKNVPDVFDHAGELIELLDALDINRAGFVRHKVGGFVMRDLAQRYRD